MKKVAKETFRRRGVRTHTEKPTRNHGRQVFEPKPATKSRTVTFRMTTSAYERLEELQKASGSGTTTELLLRALASYDLLIEAYEKGFTVALESPLDYCDEEELAEVEQQLMSMLGRV